MSTSIRRTWKGILEMFFFILPLPFIRIKRHISGYLHKISNEPPPGKMYRLAKKPSVRLKTFGVGSENLSQFQHPLSSRYLNRPMVKMLTKVEMSVIKGAIRRASNLGLVPCDFNKNTSCLELSVSKWKHRLLTLRLITGFAMLSFLVLRFPITLKEYRRTNKFGDMSFFFVRFIGQAALVVSHFSCFVHMKEIIDLFNNVVGLNTRFGLIYFKKRYVEPTLREQFVRLTHLCIFGTCIFGAACFFTKRHFPGYPVTLLEPELQDTTWVFIGFFILEIYFCLDLPFIFAMIVLIEYSYLFSTMFWLNFLSSKKVDHNSFRIYRQLYLLTSIQNMSLGKHFLPPNKTIIGLMSMVNIYALVRLRDSLDFFSYLLAVPGSIGSYVILIPSSFTMSKMFNLSSDFQTVLYAEYGWGEENHNQVSSEDRGRRLYLQNVKACPIIRCSIGSFYYMEKDAKATLVEWLTSGTINFFLTV